MCVGPSAMARSTSASAPSRSCVEVDVGVAGVLRGFHRRLRLGGGVDAAQPAQLVVVEALHAERDAVDARREIAVETAVLDRAGVGLQGDLGVVGQRQPFAYAVEQARDQFRREQAGRAAAEKDADDGAPFKCGGEVGAVGVEVGQQVVDVGGVGRRLAAQTVRVEVAVRAFLHAPRHVHVQRQRRGDQAHAWRSASLACSCASAWPRWLMRFFSAGSSSAALRVWPSGRNSGS